MSQMVVFRPVAKGIVSMADVNRGFISWDDLLKINAMIDMQAAYDKAEMDKK